MRAQNKKELQNEQDRIQDIQRQEKAHREDMEKRDAEIAAMKKHYEAQEELAAKQIAQHAKLAALTVHAEIAQTLYNRAAALFDESPPARKILAQSDLRRAHAKLMKVSDQLQEMLDAAEKFGVVDKISNKERNTDG